MIEGSRTFFVAESALRNYGSSVHGYRFTYDEITLLGRRLSPLRECLSTESLQNINAAIL